jgi:hypothetical protein
VSRHQGMEPTLTPETDGPRTLARRGLMAAAAAAAAGLVFKQAEQPASAGVDGDVVLGAANTTTGETTITNTVPTSGHALLLHCDVANYGIGLEATGTGYGVSGTGGTYAGVFGDTSSGTGAGVEGMCRAPDSGYGVIGFAQGIAIRGQSDRGLGGEFKGGRAALHLVPAATSGPPTTGRHETGELLVDSDGRLFLCAADGTPGTWIELGAPALSAPRFITLPTPERFVDTRSNLGGVQGPVPGGGTRTFVMTGRTGESGNPALQVPDAATAIVGNLTVAGGPGVTLGSYVTLWPGGPLPKVSNINFGPSATTGAVANSYVVGVSDVAGHGQVSVFNFAECDYILDVTGYYVD